MQYKDEPPKRNSFMRQTSSTSPQNLFQVTDEKVTNNPPFDPYVPFGLPQLFPISTKSRCYVDVSGAFSTQCLLIYIGSSVYEIVAS
jgi:hypothetical protein